MKKFYDREREMNQLRDMQQQAFNDYYRIVVLTGRRRVGKTFLINEVLGDGMVFHHTGLSPYDRKRKVITKSYAEKLQKRLDVLEQAQSDKKFHLTFVTVNPIERNVHSDMVQSAVTAEELFK